MPNLGPILVYSKYTHDLPRFRQLLSQALPDVEINCAGAEDEAAPFLQSTKVLYGWGFRPDLLQKMPSLRWVQKMGAGVDDIVGAWPFGSEVILTRTDGRLIAARMAEYVAAALLDKTSCFDVAREQQKSKSWTYFEVGSIAEKTIGVAGLGEIGSDIVRILRALGANVVGWRRSEVDTPGVSRLFVGNEQLGDFVGSSDAVVLVLPLTKDTDELFDEKIFNRFRRGSHLVNVGRGGVIVEGHLLRALDEGMIEHATLDVFRTEPLPQDHPFWDHPKVTVTPHICGPLVPEKVVPHFLANYQAFAAGRTLKNQIDVKRQY